MFFIVQIISFLLSFNMFCKMVAVAVRANDDRSTHRITAVVRIV